MASNQNSPSSSTANALNSSRLESGEVDYLSYMPTEIILNIFSFLPLKFWIVMSLVSKRWKYFWTQIPNLELNEFVMVSSMLKTPSWCSFCDQVHISDRYYGWCHRHLKKAATEKFISIVDRVLLLHSGCRISRFSLFIDHKTFKVYNSRINTWIDFAMTSNIENLTLNFSGGRLVSEVRTMGLNVNLKALYIFKKTLFAPKMLKSLTLAGCIFRKDVFAALNSLHMLTLIDVEIYGCRIGEVLSLCPVLETMKLERVLFPSDFMICEEELRIQDLFLMDCISYSSASFDVDIIAPSLVTLTIITGDHLTSLSIKNAVNLVDAKVFAKGRHPDPALGNCMVDLLRVLSRCRNLELNSRFIQVLPPRDNLPLHLSLEFQNLRSLRLRTSMVKQELPGLAFLMSCCPNLETLNLDNNLPVDFAEFEFIQNAPDIDIGGENYWESENSFWFHCLQKSLKKVNITGFGGKNIEMHTVKFLLENAMVLEELNLSQSRISNPANAERKLHNRGLITSFRKASPRVHIKISY